MDLWCFAVGPGFRRDDDEAAGIDERNTGVEERAARKSSRSLRPRDDLNDDEV